MKELIRLVRKHHFPLEILSDTWSLALSAHVSPAAFFRVQRYKKKKKIEGEKNGTTYVYTRVSSDTKNRIYRERP